MSGTYPLTPYFQNVKYKKRHYNLMSESLNGRTQVRSLSSSRREFTLVYPPLTRAEMDTVFTFIESQDGPLGTFTISLPDPLDPATTYSLTARLADDVQEFDLGVDNLYQYEVDIIEVL